MPDEWFEQEALPLEPALTRFLRRHWRLADEIDDLRQEIYARACEMVMRDGAPTQTQAFLFATARNLLIDRARRARVVEIENVAELEALDIQHDDVTPERIASARGELRLLEAALNGLPPRCREVVTLRKIDELSQREIALRLGIAEGTVEKQIALGMRALTQALSQQGIEIGKEKVRKSWWKKGQPS